MKFGKSIENPINTGKAEDTKNEEKDEPINPDRRKFMKDLGIAIGGAVAGLTAAERIFQKIIPNIESEEDKENWSQKNNEKDEKEELIEAQEREKMEEADMMTMAEVLDFDSEDPIKFNLDTAKALQNSFQERYRNKDKKSLEYAFYEMGAWQKRLKEIFREEGVPEELIYLAIPESHWKFRAKSPVGAAGPYQIMPKTARGYGLRVDKKIDERLDPLKSGEVCAKYLKEAYQYSGDWNLAISMYNGGFARRYVREAKKKNEPVSYKNFLNYMEKKLNNSKEEAKKSDNLFYRVRRGDTLGRIAKRCCTSIEELRELNPEKISGKNRDIIKLNDKLKLPGTNKVRKMIFLNKIRGYKENLNYPAKFIAVVQLIKKGFVSKQREPLEYEKVVIEKKQKKEYIVRAGDTLYGISKKFNIDISELKRINTSVRSNSLAIGHKLKIPGRRSLSLSGAANKLKKDLKKLTELNPAIIDTRAPIPEEYVLRV